MSFVNPKTKELFLKVVCIGTAHSGARDLVHTIASLTTADHREALQELSSDAGAVSYFALGPRGMTIKGLQVRLQIYGFSGELPECDAYVLLKGVDGIVFCASSNEAEADTVSFAQKMRSSLLDRGYGDVPVILHYRSSGWRKKKAPPSLVSAAQIAEQGVYISGCTLSFADAVAGKAPKKPDGVLDTLKAVAKHILLRLRDQTGSPAPARRQKEHDENVAKVGNYSFVMPEFWPEWKAHGESPKAQLSTIPAQNMTFDVLVVENGGTQENHDAYFEQLVPMYRAESVADEKLDIAGWGFRAVRLYNPAGLTPEFGAISELFAGVVGSDLFTFQIHRGPEVPSVEDPEKLRALCIKMVEVAIIGRMNDSPEQYA